MTAEEKRMVEEMAKQCDEECPCSQSDWDQGWTCFACRMAKRLRFFLLSE